jgi:uncharacterized membrane protein YbhN (UPF0104 family)
MITPPRRSRWYLVWYPIIAVAVIDVVYQLLISWRQADLILHARPGSLLLAMLNQVAVYVVLVPAMQQFFETANIRLSGWRVFSLIGTGLALAKIVPAGEYVVWRTQLRRFRGGVGAATQWQVMYYVWMFGCLIGLFFVGEVLTLLIRPHAHSATVIGNLRFIPIGASLVFLLLLLLSRFSRARSALVKFAADKLGSRTLSPLGIIRDRRLNRGFLATLTFASVSVWLIEAFTMFLCLRSVGVHVPLTLALFGFTFARIFTFLPLTPGGIGEIEAGMSLFFAAYGFHVLPVLTGTVLYRLITYWVPLFLGVGTYAGLRWGSSSGSGTAGTPLFAAQLHRRGGVRA